MIFSIDQKFYNQLNPFAKAFMFLGVFFMDLAMRSSGLSQAEENRMEVFDDTKTN